MRLSAAGDHAAALRAFDAVLKIAPDSAQAYLYAGREALAVGEYDASRDYFALALHYAPGDVDAALGLARTYRTMGHTIRAHAVLDALLIDAPDCADAWFELGRLQHAKGEFTRAVDSLKNGLGSSPQSPSILNLLGLILAREFGAFDEGEAYVRRALDYAPGFLAAISNLGWILAERGSMEEAVACFDHVLGVDPSDDETRLMRAHAHLKYGNFASGWQDFSARHSSPLAVRTSFSLREFPMHARPAGERILVYAEQGIGDQIMFASCIPDLLATGCRCVIECDVKLKPLFRRSFPECLVMSNGTKGGSSMLELRQSDMDYQLAIGSLPGFFRSTMDDFPSRVAYIKPDPARVVFWRQKLAELGSGPYIGISWQGGTRATRRQLRSVPLGLWRPVLDQPGQFVSLQYGDCEEDLRQVRKAGFRIEHWPKAIEDYDETAALVSALDLVISVCTAVVHLSGGLGKEVWVLTPAAAEWRYMSHGERLPWYPSAKLFRQRESGAWADVMQSVSSDLKERSPS